MDLNDRRALLMAAYKHKDTRNMFRIKGERFSDMLLIHYDHADFPPLEFSSNTIINDNRDRYGIVAHFFMIASHLTGAVSDQQLQALSLWSCAVRQSS